MMATKFVVIAVALVSSIPFDGYHGYCRAGRQWTRTPVEIEVCREVQAKPGEPAGTLAPNQITEPQFDVLRRDARIKVEVIASDADTIKLTPVVTPRDTLAELEKIDPSALAEIRKTQPLASQA